MDSASHDAQLRQAAFDHVNRLAALRGGILDSADLASGFEFGANRIPLINPQRGIFKPRQMEHLLSIKTVFPRRGARVWYDDQREAHRQIYSGDEVVDYAFMGTDPNSPDNRWLREAMEKQIPIIYFLGSSLRPIPTDHSYIHLELAPRAFTGAACFRGACRRLGRSDAPSRSGEAL